MAFKAFLCGRRLGAIHSCALAPIPLSILCLTVMTSLAENNTTYDYNGTTTNLGAFTIGNNGTNNTLVISNGGAVTNTTGTLGTGPTGDFNSAYITNAGSIWVNTGDWQSGFDFGANSNRLIIADGGVVEGRNIYPGYYGDYNSVLVSGTGSLLNANGAAFANGYFELGIYGHDNTMILTNGGRLNVNAYGYIGVVASASNNSVLVTGSGSQWTNTGFLYVGYGGPYSQLRIENGGRVDNTHGFVGQYTAGQIAGYGSQSNYISVSGPGSLWNNTSDLYLGYNAGGNTLIITNGGRVNSLHGFTGYLHVNSGSNTVIVTGSGSVWSNSNYLIHGNTGGDNHMVISDGARVDALYYLQGYTDNNTLLMTGSNTLFSMPASSFEVGLGGKNNIAVITNRARIVSLDGYIGNGATGSNNVIVIAGSGSEWTNTSHLTVGYSGGYNTLRIEDGARVDNSGAWIGGGLGGTANASNNTVVVTGSNTQWNSYNTFYGLTVGDKARHNTLIISNGASVTTPRLFVGSGVLTYSTAAGNNNLVITGPGTTVNVNDVGASYGLTVGFSSGSNYLSIADGAKVFSVGGYVGYNGLGNGYGGDYNRVLITDPGSVWSNTSYFELSIYGGYNEMVITNGGRMQSAIQGFIGNVGPSNTMIVTGSGSAWTNTGQLFVGYQGHGNSLIIANSGRVDNTTAYVGGFGSVAGSNNTVTVTDPGSVWNSSGILYLGYNGRDNTLIISNGARVSSVSAPTAASGILAWNSAASSNNTVIITGAGSTWTNTGGIYHGYSSGGNKVIVSDGGQLYASHYLQSYASTVNPGSNSLFITGSGSLVHLSGPAGYGYWESVYGPNDTLTIANGGRMNNTEGYVGGSVSGSNTVVTVTGAGSVWSNRSTLFVGYAGPSNRVTVSDGARVDSGAGILGYLYNGSTLLATNNVMEVTGSGSLWHSRGQLFMGYNGHGNTLIVSNGASFINNSSGAGTSVGSYIGGFAAASGSNQTIVVTGSGSTWTNTGAIYLGYIAGGNKLRITDGARVDSAYAYVGYLAAPQGYFADNNSVLVSGPGSQWNITGPSGYDLMYLGVYGHGNSLTVTNGGRVNVQGLTYVGGGTSSTNNTLTVTGPGSIYQSGSSVIVGSNATLSGGGRIVVSDAGTLDAPAFVSGRNGSGSFTNTGGIYQFPTAAPTITTNTTDSIYLANGTISYRGVTGANIYNAQVSNITFAGNNAFRLNSSSNSSIASYTFNATGDPRNYVRLELVNGATRWQTTSGTTIGSGGSMLVSNTTATVGGNVTDSGSILVVDSKVTWEGALTLNGSYISDPSTNTFNADVTVNQPAYLAGGVGDVFDFKKSLYIHSTNRYAFNLQSSEVIFSGGGVHTNAITGVDHGAGNPGYDYNYVYGALRLGSSSDVICFECGTVPVSASNALYVGWLDLLGDTNLVSNLRAPSSINIYYLESDLMVANAYLGDQTYQLLDCAGNPGGFLMPAVPEPSTLAFLFAAGALLLRRRAS
jgi:T5SS/PEP-CTERM-associated repeat protein